MSKKMKMPNAMPVSREGWMNWYIKRFNKTQSPMAATQAIWFQLNILAFGDRSYSPGQPTRGAATPAEVQEAELEPA